MCASHAGGSIGRLWSSCLRGLSQLRKTPVIGCNRDCVLYNIVTEAPPLYESVPFVCKHLILLNRKNRRKCEQIAGKEGHESNGLH